MLVSDYLDQVIKSRPYKYSTKQSLIRDVKRLGIADLDTSEITSALIRDKVDCIPNHNSRRRLYITARSIFKDLGVCQDLPKMEGISRIYDLPSQAEITLGISSRLLKMILPISLALPISKSAPRDSPGMRRTASHFSSSRWATGYWYSENCSEE